MNTNKTTTKKTTKKTKKPAIEYAFVVNLVDAETIQDVALAFAEAKFGAKIPLNKTDINAYVIKGKGDIIATFSAIYECLSETLPHLIVPACQCNCRKKGNLFKRFWKWLTHKK
jgi:hypothetical protein